MANIDQVAALIQSHANRDESRFLAIAKQIAADAERRGHSRAATLLARVLERIIQDPAIARLITASESTIRLHDMLLDAMTRTKLDRVIVEQGQRDLLRRHGFAPMRKLLLVGPPGTGKTMTPMALAGELGLPLFTVRTDSIVDSHLGETAKNLRTVFDAIASMRAVYLIDEVDGIGGERGQKQEVGEMQRVVNSLLECLGRDTSDSDSIVVCATNHRNELDRALYRRFDAVIEYHRPSSEVAVQLMQARLERLDTSAVDWPAMGIRATGLSHSEITQASHQVAKTAILDGRDAVCPRALVAELQSRHDIHRESRRQ